MLSAKVMGTVTRVHARLGQSVKAGDLLVEISAAEIEAQVARAEAALAQVTRDLERESSLLARGASARETVRALEDGRRQAQAALDEARAMLGYLRLTAPFDGMVARRSVEAGDLAAPGAPLLTLESTGALRVEAAVPESLATFRPGAALEIRWPGGTATGKVAEIASAAERDSRTVLVKLDLPADVALRSGQFVRVAVPAGESTVLLAPAGAVTAFGQVERVFVIEDGRARLRLVRTGGRHEDEVELLSGVRAGDVVAAGVPAGLRDGQRVEVRR
jgi:RND family efflux transporter MFP subunit